VNAHHRQIDIVSNMLEEGTEPAADAAAISPFGDQAPTPHPKFAAHPRARW
jgi:hypothetical protein